LIKIPLFIQKVFHLGKHGRSLQSSYGNAKIISRNEHHISRKNMSKNALKVLYRLIDSGFEAYLVGGGVRDLLLGLEPKDFDIATNARPEEVKRLFKNALLIGKRFRLVHVRFRGEIIEVATFRQASFAEEASMNDHPEGLLRRDNVYGDIQDDVFRRDFTANALYYDVKSFSVIDYTGGVEDIQKGVLRIIGEPSERLREDPVRMLRAVRLACKLGFTIDERTLQPFGELAHLLQYISSARLFDESIKLFLSGYSTTVFAQLRHYRLFEQLFPQTEASLVDPKMNHIVDVFILSLLKNTDDRIAQSKIVNPAYLFAGLLWFPLLTQYYHHQSLGVREAPALEMAMKSVFSIQQKTIGIPRRLLTVMQDIWRMQLQFEKRFGRRPYKLLHYPKFRAGYDFLLLRAEADKTLVPLATWWTQFYEGDESVRKTLLSKIQRTSKKKK
jgi:poly(A) polymerase